MLDRLNIWVEMREGTTLAGTDDCAHARTTHLSTDDSTYEYGRPAMRRQGAGRGRRWGTWDVFWICWIFGWIIRW